MKKLPGPLPLHQIAPTVAQLAPPTPRNNYDVAGFVALGIAGILFLIGGAAASRGQS